MKTSEEKVRFYGSEKDVLRSDAEKLFNILSDLKAGKYDFALGYAGWHSIKKLKTHFNNPTEIPQIFRDILTKAGILNDTVWQVDSYKVIFDKLIEQTGCSFVLVESIDKRIVKAPTGLITRKSLSDDSEATQDLRSLTRAVNKSLTLERPYLNSFANSALRVSPIRESDMGVRVFVSEADVALEPSRPNNIDVERS